MDLGILATSTLAATIGGWVTTTATYLGIALTALFAFAVGYAVAKGALRFVLKRLHIIS